MTRSVASSPIRLYRTQGGRFTLAALLLLLLLPFTGGAETTPTPAAAAPSASPSAQTAPGQGTAQQDGYLSYEPPVVPDTQPSLVSSTLRVVAALALVLAALLFTLYLLRRFMDRGIIKGDKGTPIRVVASKFIGPKKSIAVVDVFGRYLVVGISTGGINLLADLSGDDDKARLESVLGDAAPNNFADFLRGSMGKGGGSGDVNSALRGAADSLRERLKDVRRKDE